MSKRVIPYGNRILVRRRKIGEKLGGGGIIIASQEVQDRPTDLADVVYVPNHTFADKELIENSQAIIAGLKNKAIQGDAEAFKALLDFHAYLRIKAIQPGKVVFISKYIGTDFHDNEGNGTLTIVNAEDIIGVIENDS